MRPMQLAWRNPGLFAQTFFRYYVHRLFPGLTGWERPLAPVERLPMRNGFTAQFEVDSREMGDSNGVRQMARGCYEIYLQNVFRSVLRPGDVFVDVGANAGFFSVYAASLIGPAGAIHAFEPALRYFRLLQRNAAINPGFRFTTNNLAVSDRRGKANFYPASPTHSGGSSLEAGWLSDVHRDPAETVEIVTLSDYIAQAGIKPRLIKIDVEGHELPAVRGLMPYLHSADALPYIICEAGGKTREELCALLNGAGYELRDIYNLRRRLPAVPLHEALDIFAVPAAHC